MDGLAATKQIREWEEEGVIVKHVPIIAVTANARAEQIQALLKAGMVSSYALQLLGIMVTDDICRTTWSRSHFASPNSSRRLKSFSRSTPTPRISRRRRRMRIRLFLVTHHSGIVLESACFMRFGVRDRIRAFALRLGNYRRLGSTLYTSHIWAGLRMIVRTFSAPCKDGFDLLARRLRGGCVACTCTNIRLLLSAYFKC